ncbi:DNA polymerase beta family protein, partial [Candidatus Parcubacteria bacterium]
MTNKEIAQLLRKVAAAYGIKDEKRHRFQIIAYERAADTVEHLNTELTDIYREGKLDKIPGIGTSITSYIEELISKGKVKHFEEVMKGVPEAAFALLDVPTFGPKKAYKIASTFKLENGKTAVEDVKKLAKQGKIAEIPGFGKKSETDILRAIDEYKQGKTKTGRTPLPYALELAQKVVDFLKESKDAIKVFPLGSLRRMMPTVGDIDIAVATNNPQEVINHFVSFPGKERILEKGDTSASILTTGGKQVDLMVQKPESFGALLQHFTGSKAHNIHLREYALKKGLSLSEYGIKRRV